MGRGGKCIKRGEGENPEDSRARDNFIYGREKIRAKTLESRAEGVSGKHWDLAALLPPAGAAESCTHRRQRVLSVLKPNDGSRIIRG